MNPEEKITLRNELLKNLEDYGISWDAGEQKLYSEDFKVSQSKLAKQTNPNSEQYQSKVQSYLATPDGIDISKISPYLVVVESNRAEHQRLWAYATSLWSIPVTVGFGRRIRFFVFDKQNDKLIGIVGLCDPIIGLDIRDTKSIGWSKDIKMNRLYNSMTAYILGAIPPYNVVLGAKLVALTLLFPEVRKVFYHKYKHRAFSKGKKPYLAYIDTLGAFGKSAIYTRLLGWEFVGYTKGQSHIHITANGSWELIRQIVPDDVFNTFKFGDGPNWKMRVLKYGLRQLDLSEDMLSIGWKRGYYRLPLAENWQDYLLQKTDKIIFKRHNPTDLIAYWKSKWVLPRIETLYTKLHEQG